MSRRLSREHENVLPFITQDKEANQSFELVNERAFRTSQYIFSQSHYPLFNNTSTKYYTVGEEMFNDMLSEMEKAKDCIFFEYFIIEEENMWEQMLAF